MAGKPTRELHKLYSKKIIGKLQHQRLLAPSLTNTAKEANQQRFANEMIETVKVVHGEDVTCIEETVKRLHGFETENSEDWEEWLKKLQSDFQDEEKQMLLGLKKVLSVKGQ